MRHERYCKKLQQGPQEPTHDTFSTATDRYAVTVHETDDRWQRPRKSHCLRGHPRTPENVGDDYMCRRCRNDAKIARRARDTRPKDPNKVKAGIAGNRAKMRRRLEGASTAPSEERSRTIESPEVALYRAEKARRAMLGVAS